MSSHSMTPIHSEDCPFCKIAETYPPSSPLVSELPYKYDPKSLYPPTAWLLLSTPHVVAFLDHMPISQGHVLVATRNHRVKLSEMTIEEGRWLGSWLGVISRAVVGSVMNEASGVGPRGEGKDTIGDWNVVQNNGARAAQVVPHVHFHIIPRSPSSTSELRSKSWTIFGRGQRDDLPDDEAFTLIKQMRVRLVEELEKLREREGPEVLDHLLNPDQNSSSSKPKM